jgi:hypothetical protein
MSDLDPAGGPDELLERIEQATAQAVALRALISEQADRVETRTRSGELRAQAAELREERAHYRNMLEELRSLAENLERALESRAGIEQAKGVVMALRGCTPDEAFDALRVVSQRTNRKLAVVAAEVVERAQRRDGSAAAGR